MSLKKKGRRTDDVMESFNMARKFEIKENVFMTPKLRKYMEVLLAKTDVSSNSTF